MAEAANVARVPMQLARGCIVVSIQIDLSDAVLTRFRTDLLERLQSSGAEAVILDVSGVAIMDLEEFQALRDTMTMAALMGARTIFSGFQAGVVSALVELEAPIDDIEAAFNLDGAFALLGAQSGVDAQEPAMEAVVEGGDEPDTEKPSENESSGLNALQDSKRGH